MYKYTLHIYVNICITILYTGYLANITVIYDFNSLAFCYLLHTLFHNIWSLGAYKPYFYLVLTSIL